MEEHHSKEERVSEFVRLKDCKDCTYFYYAEIGRNPVSEGPAVLNLAKWQQSNRISLLRTSACVTRCHENPCTSHLTRTV